MSPLRSYNDPADDAAYLQRSNDAWNKILAARRSATAGQAQAVSTMAANYPHMSPGTAVPLAASGVAPDDPFAQHVALAEAKRNKRSHGAWGALGDIVKSVTHIPAAAGELVVRDVFNPVGGAVLGAARPVLRGGLAAAAAPLEVGMGAFRDVAAATGDIGAGIVSGAAAGAAGGALFGGIGAIPGAIGGAVAGGIAGSVAQARGVEIEGGYVNPLQQSTLFQSFGEAGLGKGYMPAGTAHEEAMRAQRRAASLGGHALTPGRFLANSILEPGSTPYNLVSGALDAAVTWELDPTQKALHGMGKWRKAEKAFVRADEVERAGAGLVDDVRRTVLPEKVDAWLNSSKGQKAVQWFADADFETIRNQLGKNKVDISTVKDLANAATPEEVSSILRPRLGLDKGLELKPKVGGLGMEVKRTLESRSRLFHDLPSGKLDYSNPTDAVDQFHLLLRDANVGAEEAARHTEDFATHLLDGTFEGRRAADALVYSAFLGGAGGKIDQTGVASDLLRKVARRAAAHDSRVLASLVEEDGTRTAVQRVSIDGATQGMAAPGLLAEHIDNGIDVDRRTIRDIRAVTSRYSKLIANPKVQLGVSAADHLTNDLWKPTALLRGAWTVRVVGEEQVRMAAAGRLSLFNHPLSYMSWMLDDNGRIANVMKKVGVEVGGRGSVGVTGERFAKEGTSIVSAEDQLEAELRGIADDHHAALGVRQQAEGWHDDTFVKATHQAKYARGEQGYHEALAEKIDQLHSDPLVRKLASEPQNDVRTWFIEGEGNELRRSLVEKHGAPLRSNADVDRHIEAARKQINSVTGAVEAQRVPVTALGGTLTADEAAAARAGATAGRAGNADIQAAVATGELNGIPIRDARGRLNKDFLAEVRKLETAPDTVVGSAAHVPNSRWTAKRDQAVQFMFTNLMSRPSAKLSRSPMFRQHYWSEAENIVFELDDAAKATLLESARGAKLPREQLRRLEERARLGTGELRLHEADLLLKGRALDATQDLLYDAARKGQMSDSLRILFPFMEAQKEVMKVWAKVGTENPAVVRRAQQLLGAARGSGAFYTDPTTGEEMFTFPGSEFLTEHTIGMPIPLTGRVQGLNMFGSGIVPGVGPAVQIPARWILPDKPQFDDLNKFLDPFGSSATEQQGIIEQQLPGWFTKIRTAMTAPESDRTFANSVKDVWAEGVSQGRYRTETPEDIRDGLDDAKNKARWLYFIRGLSSVAGAPTAPSPEFMAMDKDGKWHVAKMLSTDYRAMQAGEAANDQHESYEHIGPEGASQAFLQKYGNNAMAFMQGKSYSTTAAAPTSPEFAAWSRTGEAQKLKDKYGDTYALFAPQGEGFDYTSYLRNIKSGATVSLTPEQFVEQSNDRVAKMIYYNQKDRFGPTPSKEQRAWLSDLRVALRSKYPGFDIPLPGKPDSETVKNQYIPEIMKAVADPALEDNDIARAAKTYIAAREQALQLAQAAGYESFAQAKAAAPLREWLRQVGEALGQRVPDFTQMFDRVWDREMVSDDVAEAGTAA